jgi:DNA repair protein RadC
MALYRLTVSRQKISDDNPEQYSSSEKVYALLKEEVSAYDREHMQALYLDSKNKLLGIETISIGTVNAAAVFPRDIIRGALLMNATAIIVTHNHPSGDPMPSSEDRTITNDISKAAELLNLKLLDHVIFGDNAYYSFTAGRSFVA